MINFPDALGSGYKPITGIGAIDRQLGQVAGVVNGIGKYITGTPVQAIVGFTKVLTDLQRRLGPGMIWDMAVDNIFAGNPPATMALSKSAPFTEMEAWRDNDKRPLLTKDVTYNPQGTHFPDKHFPTHYDLRSLVAQSLYDPGILPPVPDTLVGLPNERLP